MELHKCLECKVRSTAAGFLNGKELDDLGENCVEAHFDQGEVIFKQDALSSNIIYLKEGMVKITMRGPYRDQILKIVKAPVYLGIPTTVGDKVNNYSAMAVNDTIACFIDLRTFQKLIHRNGKFAYEVVLNLCRNELQQFHRCINLTQKNINGRVAGALLDFSRNVYHNKKFNIHLSRTDLADLVGTSRESISRLFSEFAEEGLIKVSGKELTILEEEKLEKISKTG